MRAVSAVLILVFTCQDLAHANPEIKLSIPTTGVAAARLDLPGSMGRVEEAFKASTGSQTIYLIQDAHTNHSAQKNIAAMIDHLAAQKDIRSVYVEAGFGDVSLRGFRQTSSARRHDVGLRYLRKGELSGAELRDLVSDRDLALWGVEDPDLYWRSVERYRAVTRDRDELLSYLANMRRTVEELKPEVLDPLLRGFDTARADLLDGRMPFTEYFHKLLRYAEWADLTLDDASEIQKMAKLSGLEKKIDFDLANAQAQEAVNFLSKTDPGFMADAQKVEAGRLTASNRVSEDAFYTLLEERLVQVRSSEFGVRSGWGELGKYFEYLKRSRELDVPQLIREQEVLEERLYRTLAVSEDQSRLVAVSDRLREWKALLSLSMMPDAFRPHVGEQAGTLEDVTGFLNEIILRLEDHYDRTIFLSDAFKTAIDTAEEFYELTQKRDDAFIDRMTGRMQELGEKEAILVTGGYHSANLKRLLRERGLSYVCVTPQILQETNVRNYERLLLEQKQIGARSSELGAADSIGLLAVMNRPEGSAGLDPGDLKTEFGSRGGIPGASTLSPDKNGARLAASAPGSGKTFFFIQERLAQGGRPFNVFKIRTLTPDGHLGRFGRWVRSTGIDELPQLLNILKGDMSLFGPRPVIAQDLAQFPDVERRYREDIVNTTKPGILGLFAARFGPGRAVDTVDPKDKENVLKYKLLFHRYESLHRSPALYSRMVFLAAWTILRGIFGVYEYKNAADLERAPEIASIRTTEPEFYAEIMSLGRRSQDTTTSMSSGARLSADQLSEIARVVLMKDESQRRNRLFALLQHPSFFVFRFEIALLALFDPFALIRQKIAHRIGGKVDPAESLAVPIEILLRHLSDPMASEMTFGNIPYISPESYFDIREGRFHKRAALIYLLVDRIGNEADRMALKSRLIEDLKSWTPEKERSLRSLYARNARTNHALGTDRSLTLLETLRLIRLRSEGLRSLSQPDGYYWMESSAESIIEAVGLEEAEKVFYHEVSEDFKMDVLGARLAASRDGLTQGLRSWSSSDHIGLSGAWKITWRLLSNFASEKERAASIGVDLGTTEAGFYHMLVESLSLDQDRMPDRFDEMIWLWVQYVRTGDALLDRYGDAIPLETLKKIAEDARVSGKLEVPLRGVVPDEDLVRIHAPTVDDADPRNRVSIVEGFDALLTDWLDAQPLSDIQKDRVRSAFTVTAVQFYRSYLTERRLGLTPSFTDNQKLVHDKVDFLPLFDLAGIYGDLEPTLYDRRKRAFMAATLLGQYVDEFADFSIDLEKQPNLLWSLAHERYPSEFARLRDWVESHRGTRPFMAHAMLWIYAPRTAIDYVGKLSEVAAELKRADAAFAAALLPFIGLKFTKKLLFAPASGARLATEKGRSADDLERLRRDLQAAEGSFPSGVVALTVQRLGLLEEASGLLRHARSLFPETAEAANRRVVVLDVRAQDRTAISQAMDQDAAVVLLPEMGLPFDGIADPDLADAARYILEVSAAELYPDRFILALSNAKADPSRYFAAIRLNASADPSAEDLWRSHPRFYRLGDVSTTADMEGFKEILSFLQGQSRARAHAPKVFDAVIGSHRYRYPNIAAYDFSDRTLENFFESEGSVPLVLDLHFKAPCGLRCLFCYTEAGAVDERHAIDEKTFGMMGPDDIKEAIRQYAALGGHTLIILSIGEPLTDTKLFLEYAELAHRLGVRVVTFTNMLLITESVARRLRKFEVNLLLKLNSLDPMINDQLGGRPGVYPYVDYMGQRIPNQLKNVLEAYADRRDLIALSSDVTRLNKDEVLRISRWAYDSLGVAHFRKHLYYFGFAHSNRDQVGLDEEEAEEFDRQAYDFDRAYGYEYPVSNSHPDQYSFDMRRFLNNNAGPGGFPVRTFSHYVSGFYHNSSIVRPRFGFKKGLRVSVKDPLTGRVDLGAFFAAIKSNVDFFRDVWVRLEVIERSYRRDREKASHPGGVPAGMAVRHEKAYQLTRDIKKYLLKNHRDMAPADKRALQTALRRASEFARENPLFWIEGAGGVQIIPFERLRTVYPKGERFTFMSLHRFSAFYTFPYQSTFSVTPPGFAQDIHGHFFTQELTAMLEEGGGFNVYRLRDGVEVGRVAYDVPAFSAGVFFPKTPHAVVNRSSDTFLRNWTVKYGRQVLDRWSVEEGPAESEYTFEASLLEPTVTRHDGVTIRAFSKEELTQRVIQLDPGAEYTVSLESGTEKGFFLAKGDVEVARSGEEFRPLREGDIAYFISDDAARPMIFQNRGEEPVLLGTVDLEEDAGIRLRRALTQNYQTLMVDIDGVLNQEGSDDLEDAAVRRIIDLLKSGIPVMLIGDRGERSTGKGYRRQAASTEEVVSVFRKTLSSEGRTDLLASIYTASERGAVVANGFEATDPRSVRRVLAPALRGLPRDFQGMAVDRLRSNGLVDEHVHTESREFGMRFVDQLEFRAISIEWELNEILREKGLENDFFVDRRGEAVEINAIGVDRTLALSFLELVAGVDRDRIAVITKDGDVPGFATDLSDAEGAEAIPLRYFSGFGSGPENFAWIMDRLHFRAGARLAESTEGMPAARAWGLDTLIGSGFSTDEALKVSEWVMRSIATREVAMSHQIRIYRALLPLLRPSTEWQRFLDGFGEDIRFRVRLFIRRPGLPSRILLGNFGAGPEMLRSRIEDAVNNVEHHLDLLSRSSVGHGVAATEQLLRRLGIREGHKVVSVGTGYPGDHFPMDWEQGAIAAGATVEIFESDFIRNPMWRNESEKPEWRGRLHVRSGEAAVFEKSDLGPDSADAIILMSVLSSVAIEKSVREALLDKAVSVLKKNGILIIGYYNMDAILQAEWDRTREFMDALAGKGIDLKEVARGDEPSYEGRKGLGPHRWIAYRLVRKTSAGVLGARLSIRAGGEYEIPVEKVKEVRSRLGTMPFIVWIAGQGITVGKIMSEAPPADHPNRAKYALVTWKNPMSPHLQQWFWVDPQRLRRWELRPSLMELTGASSPTVRTPHVEVVESRIFGSAAARRLADAIRTDQKDLAKIVNVVFATGNTMIPVYEALAAETGIDWKRVRAFHLDEYAGVGTDDPVSFASYLERHIFSKVPIERDRIHFIDGAAPDLEYAEKIRRAGGADLVILGLGTDGHFAGHEPGSDLESSGLVKIRLASETVRANQKDNPHLVDPANAYWYTIGVRDILAARRIFLFVSGQSKAAVTARVLGNADAKEVPAAILRSHRDLSVVLDKDAARDRASGSRSGARLADSETRQALVPSDLAVLENDLPKWDWRKASEVVWSEQIRDAAKAEDPRNTNQENYYRNQVEVRAAVLDLIRDLAVDEMTDEAFIERIRQIHIILLTGRDRDSAYVSRASHPLAGTEMARSAAGYFFHEETSRKKLIWLKRKIEEYLSLPVDPNDRRPLITFVAAFYDGMIGTNIFPYGNHSWYMQFVNTMLRLHGSNGIAHGFLDIILEQAQELDVKGHITDEITNANLGARLSESRANVWFKFLSEPQGPASMAASAPDIYLALGNWGIRPHLELARLWKEHAEYGVKVPILASSGRGRGGDLAKRELIAHSLKTNDPAEHARLVEWLQGPDFNEAELIAYVLERNGVDPGSIRIEDSSMDTIGNLKASLPLLNEIVDGRRSMSPVVQIVSQPLHNRRISREARKIFKSSDWSVRVVPVFPVEDTPGAAAWAVKETLILAAEPLLSITPLRHFLIRRIMSSSGARLAEDDQRVAHSRRTVLRWLGASGLMVFASPAQRVLEMASAGVSAPAHAAVSRSVVYGWQASEAYIVQTFGPSGLLVSTEHWDRFGRPLQALTAVRNVILPDASSDDPGETYDLDQARWEDDGGAVTQEGSGARLADTEVASDPIREEVLRDLADRGITRIHDLPDQDESGEELPGYHTTETLMSLKRNNPDLWPKLMKVLDEELWLAREKGIWVDTIYIDWTVNILNYLWWFLATDTRPFIRVTIDGSTISFRSMFSDSLKPSTQTPVISKESRRWLGPAAVLVLFLPPMIVTALWIHFVGRIPVIFKHRRVGLNGKPFTLYKFGHMRNGDHKDLIPGASYIRRAGLDEPMQIFNIIKREMNFIGARPIQPSELEQAPEGLRAEYVEKVMDRKPGLFSLMSARRGAGHGREQMHTSADIGHFLELSILFSEYEKAHAGWRQDLRILALNAWMLTRALFGLEAEYDTLDKLGSAPEVIEAKRMRAETSGARLSDGRLFIEDPDVSRLVRSLAADRQLLVDRGGLVFDADMTLLRKGKKLSDPGNELIYRMLTELLSAGVEIGVVTGSSMEDQLVRVIEPLRVSLAGQIGALRHLSVYPDTGAVKYIFDDQGRERVDEAYSRANAITDERAILAVEAGLQDWSVEHPGVDEALVREWDEWLAAIYPNIRFNRSWMSGQEWGPDIIRADRFERMRREGGSLTLPYIEMRHAGDHLLKINVRPIPKLPKDVREPIVAAIRQRLTAIHSGSLYRTSSSGTSSVEITLETVSKNIAVRDFVRTKRPSGKTLDAKYVLFVGDDFYYASEDRQGNDESVARDVELTDDGVRTLSVGEDTPNGSRVHLRIGDGPSATAEFLERVWSGARLASETFPVWFPGTRKESADERRQLLVRMIVEAGGVQALETSWGRVDVISNYLRTRPLLRKEINEALKASGRTKAGWFLAMGKDHSSREKQLLRLIRRAGGVKNLEAELELGQGTIQEFIERRPGLHARALQAASVPKWVPGMHEDTFEERLDLLVQELARLGGNLAAFARAHEVKHSALRNYLVRWGLLEKLPIERTRADIGWLVTRPEDHVWSGRDKKVPILRDRPAGYTDENGSLRFRLDEPGYEAYRWPVLGFNEAGWKVMILDSVVRNGVYEMKVELSKGTRSFTRIFQIGAVTRLLMPESGSDDQTRPPRRVREISANLGQILLADLIKVSPAEFTRKASQMPDLGGYRLDETNEGGEVSLKISEYVHVPWQIIKPGEAGWRNRILQSAVIGQLFEVQVVSEKDGRTIFQTFQITPQVRVITRKETFMGVLSFGDRPGAEMLARFTSAADPSELRKEAELQPRPDHYRIGRTSEGRLYFSPKPYVSYPWQPLEKKQDGFEGRILSGSLRGDVYRFAADFRKQGRVPVAKLFEIGPERRTLKDSRHPDADPDVFAIRDVTTEELKDLLDVYNRIKTDMPEMGLRIRRLKNDGFLPTEEIADVAGMPDLLSQANVGRYGTSLAAAAEELSRVSWDISRKFASQPYVLSFNLNDILRLQRAQSAFAARAEEVLGLRYTSEAPFQWNEAEEDEMAISGARLAESGVDNGVWLKEALERDRKFRPSVAWSTMRRINERILEIVSAMPEGSEKTLAKVRLGRVHEDFYRLTDPWTLRSKWQWVSVVLPLAAAAIAAFQGLWIATIIAVLGEFYVLGVIRLSNESKIRTETKDRDAIERTIETLIDQRLNVDKTDAEAVPEGPVAHPVITRPEELLASPDVQRKMSDVLTEEVPAPRPEHRIHPEDWIPARTIELAAGMALRQSRRREVQEKPAGIYKPSELRRAIPGMKAAGVRAGSSVLDLGHGRGILAHAVARVLGAQVTGVEKDPYLYDQSTLIQAALMQDLKNDGSPIPRLVNGDFTELSWADHDFIYFYSFGSWGVKQLIPKAIAEMKPGSKFLLFGDRDERNPRFTVYEDVAQSFLGSGVFQLTRYPEFSLWVFEKTGSKDTSGARLAARPRRNEDQVRADRKAIQETVLAAPHTMREISVKTGIPLYVVINDLRALGLMGHANLVVRKLQRRSAEKIASDRKLLSALLEEGPMTTLELSIRSGIPFAIVRDDIYATEALFADPRWIHRSLERRSPEKIRQDREQIAHYLDQGIARYPELSRLLGIPAHKIKDDIEAEPSLREHTNFKAGHPSLHHPRLAFEAQKDRNVPIGIGRTAPQDLVIHHNQFWESVEEIFGRLGSSYRLLVSRLRMGEDLDELVEEGILTREQKRSILGGLREGMSVYAGARLAARPADIPVPKDALRILLDEASTLVELLGLRSELSDRDMERIFALSNNVTAFAYSDRGRQLPFELRRDLREAQRGVITLKNYERRGAVKFAEKALSKVLFELERVQALEVKAAEPVAAAVPVAPTPLPAKPRSSSFREEILETLRILTRKGREGEGWDAQTLSAVMPSRPKPAEVHHIIARMSKAPLSGVERTTVPYVTKYKQNVQRSAYRFTVSPRDARPAAKKVADLSDRQRNEAVKIYDHLRTVRSPRNLEQLRAFLASNVSGEPALADEKAIEDALERLDKAGFPILRSQRGWTVSGLARRLFFTLDTAQWPEALRVEWERLGRDESSASGARRVQIIVDLLREQYGVPSTELRDIGIDLIRTKGWGQNGERIDEGVFDNRLEEMQGILGVASVRLRSGLDRSSRADEVYANLKDLDPTQIYRSLRHLTGKSRRTVAEELEISQQTVLAFEKGDSENTYHPDRWPALVKTYELRDTDLFYLLARAPRAQALSTLASTEALRLSRYALGLTLEGLVEALFEKTGRKVSVPLLSMLETGYAPLSAEDRDMFIAFYGPDIVSALDRSGSSGARLAASYPVAGSFRELLDHLDRQFEDRVYRSMLISRQKLTALETKDMPDYLAGLETPYGTDALMSLVGYGVAAEERYRDLLTLLLYPTFTTEAMRQPLAELDRDRFLSDPAARASASRLLTNDKDLMNFRRVASNAILRRAFIDSFSAERVTLQGSLLFLGDELAGVLVVASERDRTIFYQPTHLSVDAREIRALLRPMVAERGWELNDGTDDASERAATEADPAEEEVSRRRLLQTLSDGLPARVPLTVNWAHYVRDSDFQSRSRLFELISAYKFGSAAAKTELTDILVDAIRARYGEAIAEDPASWVMVTSSPYKLFETVIYDVARSASSELGIGHAVLRDTSGANDQFNLRKVYANLNTAAEREARLARENTAIRLDAPASAVAGKRVLYVDDILNTGLTVKHAVRKLAVESAPASIDVFALIRMDVKEPALEWRLSDYMVWTRQWDRLAAIMNETLSDAQIQANRRALTMLFGDPTVRFDLLTSYLDLRALKNLETLSLKYLERSADVDEKLEHLRRQIEIRSEQEALPAQGARLAETAVSQLRTHSSERTFLTGLYAAFPSVTRGAVAVFTPPVVFQYAASPERLSLTSDGYAPIVVDDLATAMRDLRADRSVRRARLAEAQKARGVFERTLAASREAAPALDLGQVSGFTAVDVSEISRQIREDAVFAEVSALLSDLMAARHAPYWIQGMEELAKRSPERAQIVRSRMAEISKRALIVYARPEGKVVTNILFGENVERPTAASGDLNIWVSGFEEGSLPDLVTALAMAQVASHEVSQKLDTNGRIPDVGDERARLARTLGEGPLPQLLAQRSEGRTRPSGEDILQYLTLGKHRELLILKPILDYLNDLAEALRVIRRTVDISA